MKKGKFVLFACVFISLLLFSGRLEADLTQEDVDYTNSLVDASEFNFKKTPLNKFCRGGINALTCIIEIPTEMYNISKKQNPFLGATIGLVKGSCLAVFRGLTGLFDAVTFVFPPYNKPLMSPEYVFGRWDEVFVYE